MFEGFYSNLMVLLEILTFIPVFYARIDNFNVVDYYFL